MTIHTIDNTSVSNGLWSHSFRRTVYPFLVRFYSGCFFIVIMGLWLLLVCLYFYSGNSYKIEPGPVVRATQGAIWPKPFEQTTSDYFSIVRPSILKFEVQNESCDILQTAIERYKRIIKLLLKRDYSSKKRAHRPQLVEHPYPEFRNNPHFNGFLDEITINLKSSCEETPHPQMKEEYRLSVKSNSSAHLESDSIWGILRGLESFSQLLVVLPDQITLRVNATEIHDKPRYSYRGLLVDTSRHFINVFTLKQILDGMAYNKLNVFHWHIVDDHSFPYESTTFPELTQGAYNVHMIYSQSEIRDVIEYARLRGIRTLAEFDTPGHVRSWGVSHPEILTACEGALTGQLGPMDPTMESTYIFMQKLLAEVVRVFPDEYVHLGGDEVEFDCWKSSTTITNYMTAHNVTTYEKLEELYIQRIVEIVKNLSYKSIVWQEVFQNGVQLAPGTVVHVWTGDRSKLLHDVTKSGLPAILSSCWYLDYLSTGGDWRKYYDCEPSDFPGNDQQKSLLIGGEACMWSEVVDNSNILQRIFPRVSAAAEKLWSQENVNNTEDAAKRLEEHTCRMKKRGLPAQPPNGPGFCL